MLRREKLLRFIAHLRVAELSRDAHKSATSTADICAVFRLQILEMSLQQIPRNGLRRSSLNSRSNQIHILIPHRRTQHKLKCALR